MGHRDLSDADWRRLAPLLPGIEGRRGRSGDDNRRFLDAVKWMAENDVPWRELPPRFGRWNTVWRRQRRWEQAGVWQRLHEHVPDARFDWLLALSSTRLHTSGPAKGTKNGRGSDRDAAATDARSKAR